MKDFILKHKILVIIVACLLGLAISVTTVFLSLHTKEEPKKPANNSSRPSSSSMQSITSSEPESSTPEPEKMLVISSPKSQNVTVTSSQITFSGSSDPEASLTLDGSEVERTEDGNFAFDKPLTIGKNTFTFEHKGETKVYTVNYRYVIIESCYPSSKVSFDAGTTFIVTAYARRGSTVTATFNSQTITLKQEQSADVSAVEAEFVNYSGEFTLPTGNEKNVNLGSVIFKASFDGKNDTFSSGAITCKRDTILDYQTYVAEVVAFAAETFDGDSTDDMSRPTNSYLPQGTIDYCDTRVVVDSESGKTYYKLRCGKRVYTEKNDVPNGNITVTKRYVGSVPDHNELAVNSFTEEGRHTVLTLATNWKAPFTVELKNQSYFNPTTQDYRISDTTYEYLEIKFCYATKFEGEITISPDNPIFSSAELITDNQNTTLKLYLKNKGEFYGWDSDYDENGNLVFSFLHPAKVEVADNEYGTSLNGIKVFIDVGHGGRDVGASGHGYTEAERNLFLAQKIKAELEALGAEVRLSRNDNSAVSADTRCRMLKDFKPDFCVAVHHDSSTASSANGHSTFYSTPFSFDAAKLIDDRISQTGIYNEIWDLRWHYYYTARMTTCPVVLTENGFMSNAEDISNHISSDEKNTLKAKAITQGIVDYFNLIQ